MNEAQKQSAGVIPVDGQVRPTPERAAFEAWAKKQYGHEAHRHTSATCGEWDAWQAARTRVIDLKQPGLAEQAFAAMRAKDAQAHADRMAKAPLGACPSCYGEGEQGGQFCGGFWPCESCGGTGKA